MVAFGIMRIAKTRSWAPLARHDLFLRQRSSGDLRALKRLPGAFRTEHLSQRGRVVRNNQHSHCWTWYGRVMTGLFTWLRQDMRRVEEHTAERFNQMGGRIDRLESQTNEGFDRLETRPAAIEHGQAKLKGLREAITGRRTAS